MDPPRVTPKDLPKPKVRPRDSPKEKLREKGSVILKAKRLVKPTDSRWD